MRLLSVVAMLALLTGPAFAQGINLMPELKSMSPEEKEQDAIRQKAYRDSLHQIPNSNNSTDPWGNVRNDKPKAAAPAKQSRTKTGSATQ